MKPYKMVKLSGLGLGLEVCDDDFLAVRSTFEQNVQLNDKYKILFNF